ncbi:MAG TPA: aminoacyl-tRNA hydrolase, partial [Nakamurella multipartita]|nr:aminoacyl-tRNA hydrolase [Nakamurella multipartita]
WLGMDAAQVLADRDEAAHDIRAMQLILRMERATPPSWHRAVALAAAGATALCLDERSAPGGEWHDAVAAYVRGHIRKVTRRARGAHWAAAQELPGLTLEADGTQVRVLVPGPVVELDPRIGRLQVGGTDVPPDVPPDEPGAASGALRLWIPEALPMTVGKAMAQAGHAGMICAALLARDDAPPADRERLAGWREAGFPVTVRRVDAAQWARLAPPVARDQDLAWRTEGRLAVRDAGFTEVEPGAITIIATRPDPSPRSS